MHANQFQFNQQKEFTIDPCYLLKNRTGGLFICNPCNQEIKKKKLPKKSKKNRFKFANFPNYLIEKLKNKCKIENIHISRHFDEDLEMFERRALQLNKLEAFLVKLVIPFIRIAHCPRGSYFKVKGDLILISANVRDSLETILPLEQSLSGD